MRRGKTGPSFFLPPFGLPLVCGVSREVHLYSLVFLVGLTREAGGAKGRVEKGGMTSVRASGVDYHTSVSARWALNNGNTWGGGCTACLVCAAFLNKHSITLAGLIW